MPTGTLFIVSTPIGNLEDMSPRAVRTLKEVGIVAAEDTRRAGSLLAAFGVKKPLVSFHSHNAGKRTGELVSRLKAGENIALISDSGTPGISDPGSAFIKTCIEENINVTAIPGASAFVMGLVLSGFDTSKFVFEGFLSNKGAKRKKRIKELLGEKRTVIVYESPHRIEKFLEDFKSLAPERNIALARELTKKFEEVKRGEARTHLERFKTEKPRGEFVIIF